MILVCILSVYSTTILAHGIWTAGGHIPRTLWLLSILSFPVVVYFNLGYGLKVSGFKSSPTYSRITDVPSYRRRYGWSSSTAIFYILSGFICLILWWLLFSWGINLWYILPLSILPVTYAFIVSHRNLLKQESFKLSKGKIYIFGVPIDWLTSGSAVDEIKSFLIGNETGKVVVTPDTTSLMKAVKKPGLKKIFYRANLVTADGIGIVWASRFLGVPLSERVTGIDMLEDICEFCQAGGHSIFLLGGKAGVPERAKEVLQRKYPRLIISGTHHGYFNDHRKLIGKINQSSPDLLLVGMGFPRQEKWMIENIDRLQVGVAMGVGGSFDVISGSKPRAPCLFCKMGLEWLYRLIREPKRLGRSMYIPEFMLYIFILKVWRKFTDFNLPSL